MSGKYISVGKVILWFNAPQSLTLIGLNLFGHEVGGRFCGNVFDRLCLNARGWGHFN